MNSKYSQNTCRDRKIQRRRRRKLSYGKFSLQEGQRITGVSCEKLKNSFFFFLRHPRLVLRIPISRIKHSRRGNIFSSSKTDVCAETHTWTRFGYRFHSCLPRDRSTEGNAFFLPRDPCHTYPPLSLAS